MNCTLCWHVTLKDASYSLKWKHWWLQVNNIEMCRMLEILLNWILGQTVSDAFRYSDVWLTSTCTTENVQFQYTSFLYCLIHDTNIMCDSQCLKTPHCLQGINMTAHDSKRIKWKWNDKI